MTNQLQGMYRILFLEDNEIDYAIAIRELRKSSIKFLEKHVQTKSDYLSAIQEFNPDLIISDYLLPNFDAMEALRIRNETNVEIPFIILTGSMDEEIAVECMKKGASDYVIKDHIAQLVPAVYSVLERKEIQKEKDVIEGALRISESHYRELVEQAVIGIFNTDLEGRILFINQKVCQLLQYTREELLKLNIRDTYPTGSDYSSEKLYANLGNGYPVNFERLIKRKDGTLFPIEVNIKLMSDGNILGIIHDITERVETLNALRDSEERFRVAFDNALIGNSITSLEGKFLKVNRAFCEMLGYNENELVNRNMTSITHPEDVQKSIDDMSKLFNGMENSVHFEKRYISKEGKVIWASLGIIVHRDINGKPLYYIAHVQDITEKKIAENSLQESETRFRSLAETAPSGIFIFREDKFLYVNPYTLKMSGYSEEEFLNMRIADLIHPDFREKVIKINRERQAGASVPTRYEFKILTKEGKELWVDFTAGLIEYEGIPAIIGTAFDITTRKIAEENLRESENLFRTLTDTTTTGIFISQDDNFIEVNNATLLMCGYSREEFLRMNIRDIVHPDYSEMVKNRAIDRTKGLPVPSRYEFKILTKEGKELWVDFTGGAIKHNGKVAIIGTLFNITDRKNAIYELRKLLQAIEQSPNTVIITDLNGNIEYINPKFTEITGYSFEEVKGKNPRIIQSGLTPVLTYRKMWDSITSGYEWRGEILNKKKNGELFWESIIISSILDSEGKITNFLSVKEDITEKKKSEIKIVESEAQFRAVWENSFDALRLTDENSIILEVNQAYCKLTGKSKEELEGKTYDTVYSTYDPHLISKFKEDFKTRSIRLNYENEVTYWDGRRIWMEISNSFIDIENQPTRLLTIFREIMERKEAEKQLISAKEKAEEISRLKSNFLANMSHELRTPMIGILGFAEILKDELENPVQKEMIEIIHTGGERLLQTLNQLLDLSRIESNKLDLNLTSINLTEKVSELIRNFDSAALKKNLYLKQNDLKENIFINIDERIFTQIVNNLVNNAIKFTKSGGIAVEINEEQNSQGTWAVLKFIDTGIGISEESINLIFEEFRQASEGISRNYEGTGLGLTITKRSVELMGGTISVTSKEGAGSTFTIHFPSHKEEINQVKTFKESKPGNGNIVPDLGKKAKILFVENDVASREFVKLSLKKLYDIDLVEDGETALQKVKDNFYDIILMDIGLGRGMDGIETSREIRKIEVYQDLPIIAITAFAMKGDKDRIVSQGLTDYVSKPFGRQDLIDIVDKYLAIKK
ncbi:MAG: PAS domain S-box protein [Ignavibacteriaceae bacterium]